MVIAPHHPIVGTTAENSIDKMVGLGITVYEFLSVYISETVCRSVQLARMTGCRLSSSSIENGVRRCSSTEFLEMSPLLPDHPVQGGGNISLPTVLKMFYCRKWNITSPLLSDHPNQVGKYVKPRFHHCFFLPEDFRSAETRGDIPRNSIDGALRNTDLSHF